jgi:RNA polymerase sigma-54 factor
MALFARLELKQSQRLVITPQLQQAIKLLQLSSLDLQAYVENEVRDNPLLSLDGGEKTDDSHDGFSGDGSGGQETVFDTRDAVPDEPARLFEPAAEFSFDAPSGNASADVETSYDPGGASDWTSMGTGGGSHRYDSEDHDPFATVSVDVTLLDHLTAQAAQAFSSAQDRFIADYLIDMTDADGYIRGCLDDVSTLLGVPRCEVDRVLAVLQTFSPSGVCARSLAECLAIQLAERDRLDPMIRRFLGHLDLVASCDFQRLKKACACSAEDIADMLAEIRRCNPKPGAAFETNRIETLVPDVIVKRNADGVWIAELNPAAAPVLAVDRAYYQALKGRCKSDADRSYLAERMSSANWLAKSLEQRLSTILKVATAIVEEQSGFFDHGVRHLRPLNLRQIATKIEMHESTVSRVTSNKAMATPRGLLEMKYFFTSAIASATSKREAHSSEAVRDRIREMIVNEAADKVLSDDSIVSLLKADGIDIARRTVAKYRDALRIPSSAARRRQKRARTAA